MKPAIRNRQIASVPRGPARRDCSADKSALADYFAQMAADCMNALTVFKGPGGLCLEYEVTCEVLRQLGPSPRRLCVLGVAVRAARDIAQRDGLPWLTLEQTLERIIQEEPQGLSR